MNKMEKGSIVSVRATVYTKDRQRRQGYNWPDQVAYEPKLSREDGSSASGVPRPLMRVSYKDPWRGLIVGKSYRISGIYNPSWNPDTRGELWNTKQHPVWIVEPLSSERWLEPFACLEEDLEVEDA